jgi:transposase
MDGRELRQYEGWKAEVQFLRAENQHLQLELRACRPELHHAGLRVGELEDRIKTLEAENRRLRQQVQELTAVAAAASPSSSPSLPPFVKANVKPKGRRKRPGRKAGHAAALRPMPEKVDQVVDVPLATDANGRELCPRCRGVLAALKGHERLVEDLTPSNLLVTKFTTHSGHCINCDRRVESRAPHQPPAADVPHGQIGLNALALGVMLRVRHRLPFRQISVVLQRIAGLSVSPGGLVKQLKRIARWLRGEYEQLILRMRASGVIHADETGWRIDGHNAWAWVFTQPLLTLFVVDPSRGRDVVKETLGEAFGGKLVCDFYGAYDGIDCDKQRCLTHLLRELKELAEKDESFAADPWAVKLKRWCKDGIAHKKKWKSLSDPKYELGASRLEDRLDGLVKLNPAHAEAKRLHKRVKKYRRELTRFLWQEQLEPTNNPAERALRPLVVARKVSGGSRSMPATQAWATLSSVLATQEQNGRNVLEETKKLLMDYWATGER